jgi:hypothetical protein
MNDASSPGERGVPEAPDVSPYGTKGLESYLVGYRSSFTEAALRTAAIEAGWDAALVDSVLAGIRGREASAPLRGQARRIIRLLYLGTFIVLTLGMLVNPSSAARSYGGSTIGPIILAVAFLVAYALDRLWFNEKAVGAALGQRDLAILLSLPVVLWLVIGGLCVATGLPIPLTPTAN